MEQNAGSGERLRPVGEQLRAWRQVRRVSQMSLALDAGISTRHLSFVETGRANASRQMLALLADQLDLPLRARNLLLLAGGYAPAHPERPLDHPALEAAKAAVELVLRSHLPFPALAVDRHWNMVATNGTVGLLIAGAAPHLIAPPVNVLRLSLHPEGLAPAILNLAEWKAHLMERLRRQVAATGDATLVALQDELAAYPAPAADAPGADPSADLYVPMRLASPAGELSFLSTITVFGTPLDITLSEIAIEAFFPADAGTAQRLRTLAASA